MSLFNQETVCRIPGGGYLRGTVNIPPSKSAAHRAMLCAALADGRSVLSPIELSNDMKATSNALTALGAKVRLSGDTTARVPRDTLRRRSFRRRFRRAGDRQLH